MTWMLQVPNSRGKAFGIALGNPAASIGRTIVDQQQFKIIVSLGEDTLDRLFQISCSIQEWADDRDLGVECL
jgi:hypothetical protein